MPMELLPTLLGALPDLGVMGVVMVVLIVNQKLLTNEREHFRQERATYRQEAREDMAILREEIAALKAENRELEARLDEQWRTRGAHRPRGAGADGWSPPA